MYERVWRGREGQGTQLPFRLLQLSILIRVHQAPQVKCYNIISVRQHFKILLVENQHAACILPPLAHLS